MCDRIRMLVRALHSHRRSLSLERGVTALTILGWTPGVRDLVGGRVMSCGCLVGVYRTRDGDTVDIIDAAGATCGDEGHLENVVIRRRGSSATHSVGVEDAPNSMIAPRT